MQANKQRSKDSVENIMGKRERLKVRCGKSTNGEMWGRLEGSRNKEEGALCEKAQELETTFFLLGELLVN